MCVCVCVCVCVCDWRCGLDRRWGIRKTSLVVICLLAYVLLLVFNKCIHKGFYVTNSFSLSPHPHSLAASTTAVQTTAQGGTSAEDLNTTVPTTATVTSTAPPAEEATGTTTSADEPSTAHVEVKPRVTKPYQPFTVIQASLPVVKPDEQSTVPEASTSVVKPDEQSTVPEASLPVVKPDELSTVSNVSLPVFTHDEQSAVTEAAPPVSKPPDTQVSMSRYPSHQCPCNCDVIKRNKTSALRAAEVTKLSLTVQVKTLSSTRRRKKSASDFRVTSRSIAYLGVSFVVLASSIIILPDFVRIGQHLRYGVPIEERKPRKRACHIP